MLLLEALWKPVNCELLPVKSKEATIAVISGAPDAQLRGMDMEGICVNSYLHANNPLAKM